MLRKLSIRNLELGTGLIVVRVCVIRYSGSMICAMSGLSFLQYDSACNLELETGNWELIGMKQKFSNINHHLTI